MTRDEPALTGGCQCGVVRYRLHATPTFSLCHCRMCQKAVGGPFAAFAMLPTIDLTWTRGAPTLFASSSLAQRGFCAACGTPLTYQGPDRTRIEVTTGSLDRPQEAAPTEQFGIESRLPWLATLAAMPGQPTQAKFAGLVSHQHPDGEAPLSAPQPPAPAAPPAATAPPGRASP